MLSLRQSLKKIDYPKPGKSIPVIPTGFHSFPNSLRSAINAMDPPLIAGWALHSQESVFENLEWTEECQGITTDGHNFFVVKNLHDGNEDWDIRAIYKFSRDFTFQGRTLYPLDNHIGSPAYHNGKIYVPIDGLTSIWVLDTNLVDRGITQLGTKNGSLLQPGSVPWCAINPWNNHLYSSIFGGDDPDETDFGNVDRVYSYDPNNNFEFKGELQLEGGPIHNVQGGCFSKNGHLYLVSDSSQEIRAYSAFDGAFLGSLHVPYDKSDWPGAAEELECIWVDHWTHEGGISTYVHVMILDNDANPDDVFLKHYIVPDPRVI